MGMASTTLPERNLVTGERVLQFIEQVNEGAIELPVFQHTQLLGRAGGQQFDPYAGIGGRKGAKRIRDDTLPCGHFDKAKLKLARFAGRDPSRPFAGRRQLGQNALDFRLIDAACRIQADPARQSVEQLDA